MAKGKFGGDSNNIVTAKDENGKTLIEVATELFGEPPVFWGRYFKGPGNRAREQYQPTLENRPLRDNNLPLYIGDCYRSEWLDGNQVNPSIDLRGELLDKLILPPAA
jgi:hypothetical protein